MMLNPRVQKKAQAIIDTVIGNSRLPELSDRGSMPYLDAIVYEVLRWRPVTPLGEIECTQAAEMLTLR
jgi:cytochrome P450